MRLIKLVKEPKCYFIFQEKYDMENLPKEAMVLA